MKRVIHILSISSASLAVISLILLIVSFVRPTFVRWTFPDMVSLQNGNAFRMWRIPAPPGNVQPDDWRIPGVLYSRTWITRGGQDPKWPVKMVTIHLWLPLALFSALPAMVYSVRFWRWRRERALRLAGRCAKCGYDLRATPQRCPECGTVPATHPTGSSAAR